jgi:hypothetical protein
MHLLALLAVVLHLLNPAGHAIGAPGASQPGEASIQTSSGIDPWG